MSEHPEVQLRPSLARLVVGHGVKVKGASAPEGFSAYDVCARDEEEETCFEGPIQRLVPEQRVLRLLGRDLRVPEGATIKNLLRDRVPLEALCVGDAVVVKGTYDPERGFEPRKIKREEVYGFAIEQVSGRLEALDLEMLTLRVAGVLVKLSEDTNFRSK